MKHFLYSVVSQLHLDQFLPFFEGWLLTNYSFLIGAIAKNSGYVMVIEVYSTVIGWYSWLEQHLN